MASVWTLEQFKSDSSITVENRAGNRNIVEIDNLMKRYGQINKGGDDEIMIVNALIKACDNYKVYRSLEIFRKVLPGMSSVSNLYAQLLVRLAELLPYKKSNNTRWNKIKSIVASAGQGAKTMNPAYWSEATTHISPRLTTDLLQIWKESNTLYNFNDWLYKEYIPILLKSNNNAERERATELINLREVRYLNELERQDKKITVHNGLFYNALGAFFDTINLSTFFSGKGWGIYVMDGLDNIYSNSHITNEFHHSSFLGGAPVKAAGEFVVTKGKLAAISAKSGHYWPTPKMYTYILSHLYQHGVNLHGVPARTDYDKPIFHDALEVMQNEGVVVASMKPIKTPVLPLLNNH